MYICAYYTFIFIRIRDNVDDEDKDAYIKLYRSVLSLVPNFKKTIEEFGEDYGSVMDLINLVRYIFVPNF